MFACPHCNAIGMFMAMKDGTMIRVLEDHEDTENLQKVSELLCVECNQWFANPASGNQIRKRVLKGKGTIKTVATGVKFPFHYDTYEQEAAKALAKQSKKFIDDLFEFSHHSDNTLALRVKAKDSNNTWVYRLDKKRLKKSVQK